MNARFRKLFISAMAVCCSILLLFPVTVRDVFAFGSNWESSDLYKSIGYYQGKTASYTISDSNGKYRALSAVSASDHNQYPEVGTVGILAYTNISFKNRNSIGMSTLYLLFYSFDSGYSSVGSYSSNNLTWTNTTYRNLTSTYTAQGSSGQGTTVYYNYANVTNYLSNYTWDNPFINTFNSVFPNIPVLYGVSNLNDILAVISLDAPKSQWTWMYQSSTGGIHFSDGTELDDSNTAVYTNVYTVMDINNDNSISNEEVNYYNVTYDTNYDYSSINNDTDFDLESFLYYVALKLDSGGNPSGSSGGGSQDTPSGSGGISVGDGSFTQTQTQNIEENAINVTVNNDNSLNQENTQWLNSIINNNVGGEEQQNAFENAIGSISGFTGVAHSFALLATAVLGFLPSWVTVLLGVMFAILFVFIVFRLIHLFI